MASVGYATLQIIPSLKGIDRAINDGMVSADPTAKKAGLGIGTKLMAGVKVAGVGAAAAVGGALTASLVKGWGRLSNIEDAEAKLSGLGHSAESVAKIMDSALAAVKGTAFGMDAAATTAAGAVAAGVKPGEELTRVLKLTADAATIAGSDMGEMGAIFNKVATSNKLQGEVIAQLNDRGIPIIQMLSKTLGTSTDDVLELSKAGKIGFADFSKAMEEGLGGAALKSGETTRGAFANMGAAASRFGAGLLKGVFPMVKDVFTGIGNGFDRLGRIVEPVVATLGTSIGNLFAILMKGDFVGAVFGQEEDSAFVDFLFKVRDGLSALPDLFGRVAGAAKGVFSSDAFKGVASDVFATFGSVVGNVIKTVREGWPSIKTLASVLLDAAKSVGIPIWNALLVAVRGAATVFNTVMVPALKVLAGFMDKNRTALKIFVAGLAAGVAAFKAWQIGVVTVTAVTKAWAAVQGVMNAVMSANPIMLAVIAIAALVAAAVVAYKKVEWFRNAVDKVAAFFKGAFLDAVHAVADVWSNVLWPALQKVGEFIQNTLWPILQGIGEIVIKGWMLEIKALVAVWSNVLWPALQTVGGFIQSVIWPILQKVGQIIETYVMVQVKALAWVWSNVLQPAFEKVSAFVTNTIWPILQGIGDLIAALAEKIFGWAKRIIDIHVQMGQQLANIAMKLWTPISDGFGVVVGFVTEWVGKLVDVVTFLPKKIWDATSGMWDGIKDAFVSAVNFVIRAWNGLEFKIPGFSFMGHQVAGFTLGVPDIPELKFHGGGTVDGRLSGDEVVARLLRSETVLTDDQLGRLGSAISSAQSLDRLAAAVAGMQSGTTVNVTAESPVGMEIGLGVADALWLRGV